MKLKYVEIKNMKDCVCFCSFCKGRKMRKDVKHFKLFSIQTGREYYLNVDKKNKEVEFIEKL